MGFVLQFCSRLGFVLMCAGLAAFAVGPASSREKGADKEAMPSRPLSGRLANGLSYYIAQSDDRPGNISFQLIVRTGVLQARPEPQAAHVVEHIVIAKLDRLAEKGSVWERAARYHATVNGSTGDLSTTYHISVPSTDPDAVSAAVDIVSDWARPGEISDEEIDRERKVVTEELRRGSEGLDTGRRQMSIWFAHHPFLDMTPSRPGKLAASSSSIRRIHRQYYVAGNMAVVVTGDIDPTAMLQTIHATLGGVPGKSHPAPGASSAAELRGGHFVTEVDPETRFQISYKIRPRADPAGRTKDYAVAALIEPLTRPAFQNLVQTDGSPLRGAGVNWSSLHAYLFGVDILTIGGFARMGSTRDALLQSLRVAVALRSRRFGDAEVEKAKKDYLAARPAVSLDEDAADRWSDEFVYGKSRPSARAINEAVRELTARDVNEALRAWLEPSRRDIFIYYREGENKSVPTAAELPDILSEAAALPPLSFARTPVQEPDVAPISFVVGAPPAAKREARGVARWALPRSGATLLFRHTDDDRITLMLRRPSGVANQRAEAVLATAGSEIVSRSGLGGLGRAAFDRFLIDHGISLRASVDSERAQVVVSGTKSRWPQLLALARARMVAAECRPGALQDYLSDLEELAASGGGVSGDAAFDDLLNDALGRHRVSFDDLKLVDAVDACAFYRRVFAARADMAIVVEGNLDDAAAYAGVSATFDIPGIAPYAESALRRPATLQAGRTTLRLGEKPLAKVRLAFPVRDADPAAHIVADILSRRLFERLRYVEKGTYNSRTGLNDRAGLLIIDFECAPENVERLVAAARDEIERLGREGATDMEIETARLARKPPADNASLIADAWITHGTLARVADPTDNALRAWGRRELQTDHLHEFVWMPLDQKVHQNPLAAEK